MENPLRYCIVSATAAAAMYLLDPTSGRRRRARLQQSLASSAGRLGAGMRVAARDMNYRMQGVVAEAAHAFEPRDTSDDVLRERVRSRLGRVVSHPGAIDVQAVDGVVTLSGPILLREHHQAVRQIRSVRGVCEVDDRLRVHESATGVSSLQGGRRRERRHELMQENWSPATRLLMGAAGGVTFGCGVRARGAWSLLATALGSALLLRTTANVPLKRIADMARRQTIDIQKTIHVRAPVERVFELLSNYESFPEFMRNVRSVRPLPNGRWRWAVAGPAGTSVKWDSITTLYEPNRLLGWRTVPPAAVEHEGFIHFEPSSDGEATRLHVEMSYAPPAGAFGHVVARLFGADPARELDEDFVRLKSFLESGKLPRDAAARRGRQTVQSDEASPIPSL